MAKKKNNKTILLICAAAISAYLLYKKQQTNNNEFVLPPKTAAARTILSKYKPLAAGGTRKQQDISGSFNNVYLHVLPIFVIIVCKSNFCTTLKSFSVLLMTVLGQ